MQSPATYKTQIALIIALALIAANYSFVYAASLTLSAPVSTSMAKIPGPDKQKRQLLEKKRGQVAQEASKALENVRNASLALNADEPKKARMLLQNTLGKLDILLAKNPSLNLIPADMSAEMYNLANNYDQTKLRVAEAKDLLDNNQTQDARQILDGLISEIRLTTVSVPLSTFPAAIKQAILKIDAGQTADAKIALQNILGMLVETTEIYPLPVLQAESLLTNALEMERTTDLDNKSNRQTILKLAQSAEERLKLAQLMGYGSKAEFRRLYDRVDDINVAVHAGESISTWQKVKTALSSFEEKFTRPL